MKSTKHASMVLYRPSWCSEELCSNVAVRENCTYTYSQCSAPSWLSAVHEAAETKRFLWEQTCTWWGVTPSHSCICIFNQLESYKMYYKRLKVTSEEPSTFFLSWFVFVYLLSSLSPSFTLSLSLCVTLLGNCVTSQRRSQQLVPTGESVAGPSTHYIPCHLNVQSAKLFTAIMLLVAATLTVNYTAAAARQNKGKFSQSGISNRHKTTGKLLIVSIWMRFLNMCEGSQ